MQPTVRAAALASDDRASLAARYRAVRNRTEALAAPLSGEDQTVQTMPDVSPTKWHRAHTAWFFETFILSPLVAAYRPFHPTYQFLFNSYYVGAGPRASRDQRGLLSRPTIGEIAAYRAHVDRAMESLIATAGAETWREAAPLVVLGLHHEEQHQELILMDIKNVLALNPLDPAYKPARPAVHRAAPPLRFVDFDGGLVEIGHRGDGFAFDNEGPRHKVWLEPFRLASRLSTNGDYLDFIADGGYRRPELWLSDGWATAGREGWEAPLYWQREGESWSIFTLSGRSSVQRDEPVVHVSFYEADAFARWAGKRLASEAEWESAAERARVPMTGNLMDRGTYHPEPADDAPLAQMIGDVWEWTSSSYAPYPGYRAPEGTIGEYNGKFMANQMVLKGGAAATPEGHVRLSYRNFFYPASRWMFAGIRLAEDQ